MSAITSAQTLTISELSRGSGVAPSAVRFYEKQGLISSVRTAGNQRRFHRVDKCLVQIIRVAQRVGLSVAEIRDLLAQLPADRDRIGVDEFRWLRRQLEFEAQARIAALTGVLDDLTAEGELCRVPTDRPVDRTPA